MIQSETPVRSGTTAEWADTNPTGDREAAPILGVGEVGIDISTGSIRVGDGATAFPQLPEHKVVRTGRAILVAGTKTVTDPLITAASNVFVQHQVLGTVTAAKVVTVTRSAGVSFTLTSTDNTDTSTLAYMVTD